MSSESKESGAETKTSERTKIIKVRIPLRLDIKVALPTSSCVTSDDGLTDVQKGALAAQVRTHSREVLRVLEASISFNGLPFEPTIEVGHVNTEDEEKREAEYEWPPFGLIGDE